MLTYFQTELQSFQILINNYKSYTQLSEWTTYSASFFSGKPQLRMEIDFKET